MIITLPWFPRILSPNARPHWAVKMKAKQGYWDECFYETKRQVVGKFEMAGKVYTEIVFHPPRNSGDIDNYLASSKNGLDAMCHVLGINDKLLRPMLLDVGEKFPSGKIVITLTPQTE